MTEIKIDESTVTGDITLGNKTTIINSTFKNDVKSILPNFLNTLNNLVKNKEMLETDIISMEIEEKIVYNNFKVYGEDILEYYSYYGDIDEIIDDFSNNNMNFESRFFKYLKSIYKEIITEMIGQEAIIDLVKSNSDKIWLKIIEKFKEEYYSKYNTQKENFDEISICIIITMSRAFSKCKIFEKVIK